MSQTQPELPRPIQTTPDPLLEVQVQGLRTLFSTDEGELAAVDGISFNVAAGRTLTIVGESGCGKSVGSLSIMGLVPVPGRVADGAVRFDGQKLATQGLHFVFRRADQHDVDNAPWMALWPGLAIFLLVLTFDLLVDGLRDALDPRQR